MFTLTPPRLNESGSVTFVHRSSFIFMGVIYYMLGAAYIYIIKYIFINTKKSAD